MANIVIETRMKEYLKEQAAEDMRVAAGVTEKLEEKVQEILKDAIHRAKENGRKTLQPQDL